VGGDYSSPLLGVAGFALSLLLWLFGEKLAPNLETSIINIVQKKRLSGTANEGSIYQNNGWLDYRMSGRSVAVSWG